MTRQRSLQGNTDEGKEMQLSNAKGRDVRETSKFPLGAQNRFLPSACQTFLLSLLACPSEISIIWFLLIYLFFFIPALQAGELCLQLLDKLPVLLPPAPVVLPHSIIQLSRHETMIRRLRLQRPINLTGQDLWSWEPFRWWRTALWETTPSQSAERQGDLVET